MKSLLRIFVAAAVMLSPAMAWAHHSRANFLLDQEVSFPAVVKRFEYTNPHSYLYAVRTDTAGMDEEWIIELGSIPNLSRMDMRRDSLKPGDKIFVRGNPDRDPRKKYAFLVSVTTQDGRRFAMKDVFDAGAKARASGAGKPGSPDFSGIWAIDFGAPGAILTGAPKQPDLPVNAAGKAMLATFNADEDPFFFCVPIGVPRIVNSPYALIIERGADKSIVKLKYEFSPIDRIVHLNAASAPAGTKPSIMGYSVGRFDKGALVIETTNFTPEKWGLAPGLDSSTQKKVTERYALSDDGRLMSVEATVTDPAYLTAPVSMSFKWHYSPAYEVTPYVACDKEAAAKHIEIEHKGP